MVYEISSAEAPRGAAGGLFFDIAEPPASLKLLLNSEFA